MPAVDVALNGDRPHPSLPRTPDELAADARGRAIRTGLEDTGVLPDGRVASGNAELVAAAVATASS